MKCSDPDAVSDKSGAQVRVILDASARPGVRACGSLMVGRVYSVPKDEADRLIAAKGFRLAKAADDKPATTTEKD